MQSERLPLDPQLPLNEGTAARLEKAIEERAQQTLASDSALRVAVRESVRELRRGGMEAEAICATMAAYLRHIDKQRTAKGSGPVSIAAAGLFEKVAVWCLMDWQDEALHNAGPARNRSSPELTAAVRDLFDPVDPQPAALRIQSASELEYAIARAASQDARSIKALNESVRRVTRELKQDGLTPEAVLIAVKTIIRSAGPLTSSADTLAWSNEQLRQRISTWCIKEYFRV